MTSVFSTPLKAIKIVPVRRDLKKFFSLACLVHGGVGPQITDEGGGGGKHLIVGPKTDPY